MDHLFKSLVLSTLSYGLQVYGSAKPELTTIQRFLDKCYKQRFTTDKIDIQQHLEIMDRNLANKVKRIDNHPLRPLLPKKKETKYALRKPSVVKPKINTERMMNVFSSRLIFKY